MPVITRSQAAIASVQAVQHQTEHLEHQARELQRLQSIQQQHQQVKQQSAQLSYELKLPPHSLWQHHQFRHSPQSLRRVLRQKLRQLQEQQAELERELALFVIEEPTLPASDLRLNARRRQALDRVEHRQRLNAITHED